MLLLTQLISTTLSSPNLSVFLEVTADILPFSSYATSNIILFGSKYPSYPEPDV